MKYMDSLIKSVKSLQEAMFECFTSGMNQRFYELDGNLYTVEGTSQGHENFRWDVIEPGTDGKRDKVVYSHVINRGEYGLNDVRLGVWIKFLSREAEKLEVGARNAVKSKKK